MISKDAKNELIVAVKQRYSKACKKDKTHIMDEFDTLTWVHRKHTIRILCASPATIDRLLAPIRGTATSGLHFGYKFRQRQCIH
jgi:hypothetical protein